MRKNLERLASELGTVLEGLDARHCMLTPGGHPEKWNIQQIVEHLVMSYRSSGEVIQVRLDKAKPTRSRPSLQQRFGQFFLIRLGYFPPGREAPPNVVPQMAAPPRDGTELTQRIRDGLGDLNTKLARAQEMFGGSRFASHVVLGSLSAGQWAKFHLVHGRHHIKQIRQIRRDHTV